MSTDTAPAPAVGIGDALDACMQRGLEKTPYWAPPLPIAPSSYTHLHLHFPGSIHIPGSACTSSSSYPAQLGLNLQQASSQRHSQEPVEGGGIGVPCRGICSSGAGAYARMQLASSGSPRLCWPGKPDIVYALIIGDGDGDGSGDVCGKRGTWLGE